ncbi:MAG: 2Fe-2S iron-sulfur cluster binding domain-containing protein [Thiobacillus sp.]|nr:2Fe-2S iron-sulfur cluster binding domain-containing protein [Thiobacillus sp.]
MLATLLLLAAAAALLVVGGLFVSGLVHHLRRARSEAARLRARRPLPLVVIARLEHGDDVFSVELEHAQKKRLPAFAPGQALTLLVPGTTLRRRYSLAAWEKRPRRYRLGIRREADGAASPRLYDHLQVGARIDALPPVGRFVLDPAHETLVLVGGGIGATPMLAMLDAVAARPGRRRVVFHHAARHPAELVDLDRLTALGARADWFDYRPIVSRPDANWRGAVGRLAAADLVAGLAEPACAHYYFCARETVMREWMDALAARGVPASHLHWESFGGAQNPDAAVYPVELDGVAREFAGEPSLLAAFEAWGVDLPAECRAGECGACRVRLVSGELADCQASHVTLPPGEFLACCKVPKSALVLARVP